MAESSFYISDNDRKGLCEYLLSNKYRIIPNLQYPTSDSMEVKNGEEFIELIESQTVNFFILHDDYQIEPLKITQNIFIDLPSFAAVQRTGGPYISISLYRGYSISSIIKYKRTDIFHYAKYIHIDSTFEFNVGNELKQHYKEILNYIRSKCMRMEREGRKYWVSKSIL